jgi:hypothetical protein
MEQWLVSFDTDRIKDYIFATDKLRELRGASQLLNDLNHELTWETIQTICPESIKIYFAGGSGALLVPSEEKAHEIIAAVENLYQQKTYSASITGTCIPLSPATETSGFGQRMQIAALKLREVKDNKARRALAAVEPYMQPCTACQRYPATCISESQPICESCHAKREREQNRRMVEVDKRREDPKAPRVANDLTELGELARPSGYIGFIYADGNNMGDYLEMFDSLQKYQKFAEGLDQLVQDSVKNAAGYYSARGKENIQPYEALLIGGDDLMIVTTADVALYTALEIAKRFEQGSRSLKQEMELPNDLPLTLGVGVVIAHSKFPIAAFQRLADQLLRNAKRCCATNQYAQSAVDYMVVTEAGSSDVNKLREDAFTEKTFAFSHGNRRVFLTQRPYQLQDLQLLLSHLQKLKHANFPRSQLQFLYEGLFHSQLEAMYRWNKVAGRVKNEHRERMDEFERDFCDGLQSGFPPWKQGATPDGTEAIFSSLGDLIELYPYVPKEVENAITNH